MAGYTGSIADAGRLIHLAKRRERQKEDIEKQKKKIQQEANGLVGNIGDKFKTHYDAIEHHLKTSTVGLVTLDEMRSKQENMIKEREKQLAHKQLELELKTKAAEEAMLKRKREEQNKKRVLSFDFNDKEEDNDDDDDAEDEDATKESEFSSDAEKSKEFVEFKRKKLGKDPTVDTSFLPDKEREEEENKLREKLMQEWAEKQEILKNESINIAFSYWDGSGHRRDQTMKKGHSVHHFLQKALELLRKDFNELKVCSADSLMFVKEDLIIPHFYTFYDFMVTKAMGKTGPLFEFDAAGELRIRQDAKSEMNAESHPAKVVLRSWYEKNKHIYPASRWEPFDPNKKYYERKD